MPRVCVLAFVRCYFPVSVGCLVLGCDACNVRLCVVLGRVCGACPFSWCDSASLFIEVGLGFVRDEHDTYGLDWD